MPRQKRLNEIMLRKGEIAEELKIAGVTEVRIAELNTEVDSLITEENQLRSAINLEGKLGNSEPKPQERQLSDVEQRGKDLREKRAVTIGGGTLVKPMDNQSYINEMMGSGNSAIDLVKATNCYGMSEYQVPYQSADATAAKNAENTDPTSSDMTVAYSTIKPVTVTTYSEISREAMKLTDVDYFSAVKASAQKALRKKVSEFIIKSDATSSAVFIGIKDATAITASTDIALSAVDEKTLRKITLSYGGDDDIAGEGILFLTKTDLIAFGDVRGTDKKAVYEITPDTKNTNTGIIKDGGLSVRYSLNSSLTDLTSASTGVYSMFYGIPSCYELGLFSDFTVRVSEDAAFKKRMIAVLGEVIIGGNVTVKNGFVRVKKAASGS